MSHRVGVVAVCIGLLSIGLLAEATPVDASSPCVSMPLTQRAAATSDQPSTPSRLTIATLNTAGDPRVVDTLTTWARERAVDVLLLQEVGNRSRDGVTFAESVSDRLGFAFVYAPAQYLDGQETQGLAILSRHRLENVQTYPLPYHRLRFRSRCRIALAANVITHDGPVRVINVHLDTRINSEDRVEQLAPLVDEFEGVNGPRIIGGDLNTMNLLWFRTMWPLPFLQRQTAAVRARLKGFGFHTPFTDGHMTVRFLGLPFPLSLDWLYLKGLNPLESDVDTVRFSDHRGVWVRLQPSTGTPAQVRSPASD